MTGRLRGLHISDPGFADAFGDFTEHSDNDRWPEDHPDVNARGQPKDGAVFLNEEGYCLKCAVKVVGFRPPAKWEGVGTRHEAALACAWSIHRSVILVRSDSGKIHGLVRQEANIAAYQLVKGAEELDLTSQCTDRREANVWELRSPDSRYSDAFELV